jgi:hypothetical protein
LLDRSKINVEDARELIAQRSRIGAQVADDSNVVHEHT